MEERTITFEGKQIGMEKRGEGLFISDGPLKKGHGVQDAPVA